MKQVAIVSVAVILSTASLAWAMPSSTSSAEAAAGSQIRTDQDPVYHLYIQSTPLDGVPVLGPESSSGWFRIGSTIQDTNSSLYLNVDTTATTSYKPLTLDESAETTTWSLSGDTIVANSQQNFVVCALSGSDYYNFYLQTVVVESDNGGVAKKSEEKGAREYSSDVVLLPMPFDPVRDAVLNSPISNPRPLPSPLVSSSLSPSSSYFHSNYVVTASAGPTTSAAAAVQSPSSARRATDLSVLLNSDDDAPPPSFQRRSSSSSSVLTSPSVGTGTPRPRSAHLSHILQPPNSDDGSPLVLQNTNNIHAMSTSPFGSPLTRNREILSPSLSRSRAPSIPTPALGPTAEPLRRASSSSISAFRPTPRSPEMPRALLNNAPLSSSPDPPAAVSPLLVDTRRPPQRSTIPYAPQNRRTAAGSVLVPLSEEEREFYKKLSKNPLKENVLGKRKYEELSHDTLRPWGAEEPPTKLARDVGLVVQHYNLRPDVGVTQRQQSPIIGLKNFNNWVKSVLIARFAHPVLHRDEGSTTKTGKDGKVQFNGDNGGGRVLDLGCGKGGDLNKWQKARVKDYVAVDIAAISIEQARHRYRSSAAANPLKSSSRFTAFFAALDCFSHSLSEVPNIVLPPRAPPFDVVSMQFCMHYAFESVQKARLMLENVTRWLRKGGRFIGTIPNDRFLLDQLDALPPDQDRSDLSFGNAVYRIKFDDRDRRPVFGHRYSFFLRDAVEDVPEYIVHWDNFVQMASEYQLRLLYKAEFHDVYAEHCEHPEFSKLLQRMKVVDSEGESQMDEDQWEAANVYVAFAFEKVQ